MNVLPDPLGPLMKKQLFEDFAFLSSVKIVFKIVSTTTFCSTFNNLYKSSPFCK